MIATTVKVGPELIVLIMTAYRMNRPFLVSGAPGIGKSEICRTAAERLGIECSTLDLSILQPCDLVGMPYRDPENRTCFAPPETLPRQGQGLLVLEELNRASEFVRASCLQLLTARTLNSYRLPAGWLPCALINDLEDDDEVQHLNPALLSRFLRVRAEADVKSWVEWARTAGTIHPKVIAFLECCPAGFGAKTNPRSWTYVSDWLKQEQRESRPASVAPIVVANGLLGDLVTAESFVSFFTGAREALDPLKIVKHYSTHAALIRGWIREHEIDLLYATLNVLCHYLERQDRYDEVVRRPEWKKNVQSFFRDLPGDIRAKAEERLEERGFTELSIRKRGRR